MNVLFIVLNHNTNCKDRALNNATIPFGVLSLASYIELKTEGVFCHILDLNIYEPNQHETVVTGILEKLNPQIIGLSIMYSNSLNSLESIIGVLNKISDAIIVGGGVVATTSPEDIFNIKNCCTALCAGEGEIPMVELINTPPDKRVDILTSSPSWLTKEQWMNGKKAYPLFINDLDELPTVNYSKIDINSYNARIMTKHDANNASLPIHTTRGCPYNCIFCTAHATHGKKIRSHSSKRVLDDISRMVDVFGAKKICIDDDQFLSNKLRAKEILKGIADIGVELECPAGFTSRFIDDEIAELLHKCNVRSVILAIESGSPRVLKEIIQKPSDLSDAISAITSLRKFNMWVQAFFIIGFPGETSDERKMTRNFALDSGLNWSIFSIATPFKGSRLYEICNNNGWLDVDNIASLNTYKCFINAPDINSEAITKEAYLLNLDVNFVNNYDMRCGNYIQAKNEFNRILERYPKHAFAHYFMSICCTKLSENALAEKHKILYGNLISSMPEWAEYSGYFNLDL